MKREVNKFRLSDNMKRELRVQAKYRLIGFILCNDRGEFSKLAELGLVNPESDMVLTPLGWQTCIDLNLLDDDEVETAYYLAKGYKIRGRTDKEIEQLGELNKFRLGEP